MSANPGDPDGPGSRRAPGSPRGAAGRLREAARAWIADDPDERTGEELRRLLEDASSGERPEAAAELADRFAHPLEFGTAGLRGAMAAGPNRMNRVVVTRAAAGLAGYLLESAGGDYVPQVVIGYDARHNSSAFALDTAAVLTAAGVEATVLSQPRPTPVLAFAVQHLQADAGVMITASHNPAGDNGYKVYLGGRMVPSGERGAQIVPPHDALIAGHIERAGTFAETPRARAGWTTLVPTRIEGYLRKIAALATTGGARELRIVYTPLHGVGGRVAVSALRRCGFEDVDIVPEQAEPDPDFPTTPFPNPEEPGALDLAIARAGESGADLVLANDPDADRCAVAVPEAGGWRQLSGDEVGALLGWHIARRMNPDERRSAVFANSIVSSRLLARVAASFGIEHRETLTGFKWISRVPGLTYGYEEAIGYCVDPANVRDKDGIAAAVLIADLAAGLAASGGSVAGVLDELAGEHGVHLSAPLTVRIEELSAIDETMRRLYAGADKGRPAELGGCPVERIDRLDRPSGDLPATPGLRILTADGSRVVVRPSGTEPKLKCYLEVIEPADRSSVPEARARARNRLDRLTADVGHLIGATELPGGGG